MSHAFTIRSEDNGNIVRTKEITWDDIFNKKNAHAEISYIFRDPNWIGTAKEEIVTFVSETPQTLIFKHVVNIYHADVPRKEYAPLEPETQVENLVFNKIKRTHRRVTTRNSFQR